MKNRLKNIIVTGVCIALVSLLFSECGTIQRDTKIKTLQNSEAETQSGQSQLKNLIVGTGQTKFYDKDGNSVTQPAEGERFYGQDAQYGGIEFSFTDNGDGTVTDNTTGLMWQQIPYDELVSFTGGAEYCKNLELAGYDDWRIPSTKELFSLTNFEPKDNATSLDTNFFKFPPKSDRQMGRPMNGGEQGRPQDATPSGDRPVREGSANVPPPPNQDEGEIGKEQSQFWTSDLYKAGTTHGGEETGFGVNHYSGHIKGYPTSEENPSRGKHVRAVRGNVYLENEFVDNEDGTISDLTTGLMWMQDDYGESIMWEEALAYCENLEYAGHDDWKLPNVKELHSIVDYSGVYPAVNPNYFNNTKKEDKDYYTWLWTSTSAHGSSVGSAWYVSFGKAVGLDGADTHGAGAVRERQKYEESVNTEEGDTYVCSLRAVRVIN